MTSILEFRREATQATVDRFNGHPFEWGQFDCAKMVAFHLRRLGRPVAHAKAGSYGDALGAARALRRLGFDCMGDLMASRFEEIAPASCLLGDVIEFKTDSVLGALGIALGNNAAFCYSEEVETGPIAGRINEAVRAWRVV